ncbi:MAG TPA: hypothetical protein VND19_19420 [Acetobacteraceae bacterium]|nr:hypothetical protein [Acetobacteraceae bacterium]
MSRVVLHRNGAGQIIDSRADLDGDALLSRHRRIVAPNRAEPERVLSEYRIAWTMLPSDAPIVQILDQEPGWRPLVKADGIAIPTREDQPAR